MFLVSYMSMMLFGCPESTTATPSTDAESAASTGTGTAMDGTTPPPPPPGQPESSPAFVVTAGEGVKLSGSVAYSGTQQGNFHLDFVEEPQPGHFPKLVHSLLVPKAGPWELEVPKGYGKVGVVVYLDVGGDGPTATDPGARVPGLVEIADADVSGLDLLVVESPDLGEFTPGLQASPAPAGTEGAATPSEGAAATPVDPAAATPTVAASGTPTDAPTATTDK